MVEASRLEAEREQQNRGSIIGDQLRYHRPHKIDQGQGGHRAQGGGGIDQTCGNGGSRTGILEGRADAGSVILQPDDRLIYA